MKSSRLESARILLGVSGGIAAYKSAELTRELIKLGADVNVVMTQNAKRFITPLTMAALSDNPVSDDMFSRSDEAHITHVDLPDRADILLIAPATANIIAKLAGGIADDMLSTMALVFKGKLILAPAMNSNMYAHPTVKENLARLESRGAIIVPPGTGELACGYVGEGRLAELDQIVETCERAVAPDDLAGLDLVVTSGPNHEPIDPIRYISNRSSGKMGHAIALAAVRRKASVTLVTGPTCLPAPLGVKVVRVGTADEMLEATRNSVRGSHALIMAAAVADFKAKKPNKTKLKKNGKVNLNIELSRNPDILYEISRNKGRLVLVGFAAETDNLIKNATEKLKKKKLDMIVANPVNEKGAGFEVDTNIISLIYSDGRVEEHGLMSKDDAAEAILDAIKELLKNSGRGRR